MWAFGFYAIPISICIYHLVLLIA